MVAKVPPNPKLKLLHPFPFPTATSHPSSGWAHSRLGHGEVPACPGGVGSWPCCAQRFLLRMRRCMHPFVCTRLSGRAGRRGSCTMARLVRRAWQRNCVVTASAGAQSGATLRAPPAIGAPLVKAPAPSATGWEPEMPGWGTAESRRQLKIRWLWRLRTLHQTLSMTAYFFSSLYLFLWFPNKKADYFFLNEYLSAAFPWYRKWLLREIVASSSLGKSLRSVGKARASSHHFALQYFLPEIPCVSTSPFLCRLAWAMLCVQENCNSIPNSGTWLVYLSWMKVIDRMKNKGKFSVWRNVLGKQQFPSVTCIFPSSVYFHCLQIYNSISLLLLLFRLLDSVFICLVCFESNKKVFLHIFWLRL